MALPNLIEPRDQTNLYLMVDQARQAGDFLKALAHESRLLILCCLAEGEKSVSELEKFLSLRQATVSQQLARLRLDGFLTTRRVGKTIYYSIADEDVRIILAAVYEVFCKKARVKSAD